MQGWTKRFNDRIFVTLFMKIIQSTLYATYKICNMFVTYYNLKYFL